MNAPAENPNQAERTVDPKEEIYLYILYFDAHLNSNGITLQKTLGRAETSRNPKRPTLNEPLAQES